MKPQTITYKQDVIEVKLSDIDYQEVDKLSDLMSEDPIYKYILWTYIAKHNVISEQILTQWNRMTALCPIAFINTERRKSEPVLLVQNMHSLSDHIAYYQYYQRNTELF